MLGQRPNRSLPGPITYDGLAYNMNNAAFLADGISCAEGDEAFTDYSFVHLSRIIALTAVELVA